MDGGWRDDPTGRHRYRWLGPAGWTEHVSDGTTTGVDPLAPAAAPPPGPPPAQPGAWPGQPAPPAGTGPGQPDPAPGRRSRTGALLAVAGVVVVALVVGAVLVLAGGDDEDGDDTASADTGEPATDPTEQGAEPVADGEPATELAAAIGALIAELPAYETACGLTGDDVEAIVGHIGSVSSVSGGADEVAVDAGPLPSAYCNIGTSDGLVSVSAVVTDLAPADLLDQAVANFEAADDAALSSPDLPALDAASTGEVAALCISGSTQAFDQCRYVWSDGAVALQFADVRAEPEQDSALVAFEAYVAAAQDRFG